MNSRSGCRHRCLRGLENGEQLSDSAKGQHCQVSHCGTSEGPGLNLHHHPEMDTPYAKFMTERGVEMRENANSQLLNVGLWAVGD